LTTEPRKAPKAQYHGQHPTKAPSALIYTCRLGGSSWPKQRQYDPTSRILSRVEHLFKNFLILRSKLIYLCLFAMIASCQIYDLAVTMRFMNKRIFPFSPRFVMYEFFYE
jgi:hypothetical protein